MPIANEHSIVRRVLTRLFRRSVFEGGRVAQRILLSPALCTQLARVDTEVAHTPRPCVFVSGDVLLLLANSWDYIDYTYLTHIVKHDGVRLISVIYDVIQVEMPYTSPSAPHIFHRHCVELGHLASHLIAISKHSMESYRRFVEEPNEVDPAITWATLPNFLYDRRDEIGETTVPHLFDRPFVVYCSTIETRKNHQMLLHTWDRLRQHISPDKLPILVFVGKWGWGTEYVRLLSQRNWRLREHLRILNETSDAELIWLYRHARFTVFPALAEGFGLAAAESLSFGTPVIIGDCPALIEATEGLMPAYDPLDLPSWLAEMRRLVLDDDYLLGLRKRAAQFRGARYRGFADAVLNTILTENDKSASSILRKRIQCAAA
jgi:glycosyltransferase involved in cell wall biosynthesis